MTLVLCCGRSGDGQLGPSTNGSILELAEMEVPGVSSENIRCITGSKSTTILLTRDGLVYSAGRQGVLGRTGDQTPLSPIVQLDAFTIKSVACGEDHVIAVSSSGSWLSWGFNAAGQCALPPPNYVAKPTHVRPILGAKVELVACGARHSLALCRNGEVYGWGDASAGQLGVQTDLKLHSTPTRVTALDGIPITQVAAGGLHSAALTTSGQILVWGCNSFGQLGLGDTLRRPTPRLITSLSGHAVRSVRCGEQHTAVLTEHGAVLTWGDGNYGQLGHGNTNQQIVPRQVSELMGIKIRQIASGYNHVIATDGRRVFGWGSCSSGQLARGSVLHHVHTPTPLTDTWTAEGYVVGDVYCGGEQTFIRLSKQPKSLVVETRVWDADEGKAAAAVEDLQELGDPTQITAYVTELFGSVSNVNSLFVSSLPHCLSSGSGIEMLRMRKFLALLKTVKHPDYHKALAELLNKKLMPCLPHEIVSPEQLRIFCILPEFNSLHYPSDFVPHYCRAILELPKPALETLCKWFSGYEVSYFEALLNVCKKSVYKSLVNRYHDPEKNSIRLRQMEACLKVLSLLSEINATHEIVPYNSFYIHELADQLDLDEDYRNWKEGREIVFCRYPFLLTASVKARLLTIDANHQMNEILRKIAFEQFVSRGNISLNPYMELKVRRSHLLQDTLRQIQLYENYPHVLKKPLKVIFEGEEGYDAGGVQKEFFLLLMRELLSPDYGMFTVDAQSRFIWFSTFGFENEANYRLIGVLCGLAIYNSTIVDINFPPALYKKLLHMPITLADFAKVHPTQGNTLRQLLAYNEPDFEDVMCLNFSVTRDFFGEVEEIDLRPGGRDLVVTLENKQQYINEYIDYYLNSSMEAQYNAFAAGFLLVAGGEVFKSFHPDELMHMVSGMHDFNFADLESITEYKGGYSPDHPVIRIFWEVVQELELGLKKKFLCFLTGSDRIPIHGIHSIKIIIQKVKDNSRLPVAHTCFNLLDLPPYANKEMLKEKLLLAIRNTEGFGLV